MKNNRGYADFLKQKNRAMDDRGLGIELSKLNRHAFEWQKDIIRWAIRKGTAAVFADCGLGKSLIQLDWASQVNLYTSKPVLILAPLMVAQQTVSEGEKFGIHVNLCEKQGDVTTGINVTNYEKLHLFDTSQFSGIVLDESSILKHFSSKTRSQLISQFENTPFKLCCTATPSPNDYMELGNHSEFLNIMTRSEMLSTFFIHDGSETQKWRLKGHAEDKFWEWLSSWAAVIKNPCDLGYEQDGYDLPPLKIVEYSVNSNNMESSGGQMLLLPEISLTLNERRSARRNSLKRIF